MSKKLTKRKEGDERHAPASLHERMRELQLMVANDPDQAKALLKRAGILTRSGSLVKAYS